MQVSVETGEGLERRMTVELPAERIEQEVTSRLKQIGRTARMDGFRPGKVPMGILRRQYGGQVLQEVYGHLIETSYQDAIAQEGLNPAGPPKVEPKKSEDEAVFGYVATFDVMPEIEKVEVAGTIKRPAAEVTDADIDEMIEKLRKQRISWNPVDRPAADGDRVMISFKGIMDGEAFEGGSADNVPLVLGSHSMIDGFEEALVGLSKGDSKSIDLQFPEDYRVEELAGKPVTFEVEVGEVSEPVLPEVDDEFAKGFGSSDGIEALKADIRENMVRELEQRTKARVKSQAMDLLLEANDIDVPSALVDEEIEALRNQARSQMAQSGASSSIELPREMFEEQAKKRVKLGLLIAEVIKQNGIELDEERVRKTIEDYAASYEQPEEVVKHYYDNREQLMSVQNVVLEDQVVDWVLEQVQVDDEPMTFADLAGDS